MVRSKTRATTTWLVTDAQDPYSGRVDAQLGLLIETVWAAEKMWRLEDRIEGAVRTRRFQKT